MNQKIERKCKCCDCGKKINKDKRIEVRNPYKAFVCEECAEKNYGLCENCNHLVFKDYIAYSGSVQCCDKCASKIQYYTRMGNPVW